MERKNHMRKNSKNEKVIRAMAIGISAMLMASSPLTALAAEGEGNSSEGNEDKNITHRKPVYAIRRKQSQKMLTRL